MSTKYPRTQHLLHSLGATSDDKRVASHDHLIGVEVVITEKIDGENRCMTRDAVFARTHAVPVRSPWASWARRRHAEVRWDIDPGLSVFMEDAAATHSIWYRRMVETRQYLHLFGVRDDATRMWWSWDDVELMSEILNIPAAHVIFRGVIKDEDHLRNLMVGDGNQPSAWGGVPCKVTAQGHQLVPGANPQTDNIREGCVIRLARAFHEDEFPMAVAKVVRPDHVQTSVHWKKRWKYQHEVDF